MGLRQYCPLFLAFLLFLSSCIQAQDFSAGGEEAERAPTEQEREDDALEAYHIQQTTLSGEQESLLNFGLEEALTVVKKLERSKRRRQVRIFTDLWENAKGITIVKTLALLFDSNPESVEHYYGVNSDAMERAEESGYSFKVSEALYVALTVTDSSGDHYHLLNALLYRMNSKNEESKGSGCQYIQFLFMDAEAWAIDEGRALQFYQGFDDKEYLELTECFLPECQGSAADCCGDEEALTSGMCSCEVINESEGTVQCEHNLFWTAPRTIWMCGTQDCVPEEKCLCAKKKKASKRKRSGRKDGEEESEESDTDRNRRSTSTPSQESS